ncbi:MAG: GHKL domain-containing protein [Eubacteriales bacterium]|nr:GHKL domain-containing protein [Eubacteriales bacterium]
MPELYRIVEVSVYALLNFLPLAILGLYLFRHMMWLPKWVVVVCMVILSIMQIGIGNHVAFYPNAIVSAVSLITTLLYAVFFLYMVKAPVGKPLFVLLLLSNIENYVVISSKCLEGQLFPELARQQYRWSFSVCMLIVLLILSVPLYLFINRVVAPVVENENNNRDWRYLWLVPGVFYFIWYCCIYLLNEGSTLEMALRPKITIIFTAFNLGAFLVYFVVVRLVQIHEHNRILEEEKKIASIQLLQYQNLQEKILETRRTRHDLRHHQAVLKGYLKKKDYERLEGYLVDYTREAEETESIHFCNHDTVNVILLHFANLAREHGILFLVEGTLSGNIAVQETDLSVLFGNLLENALDACIADSSSVKKIIVRIKETPKTLYFTIDNTCRKKMKRSSGNQFLSTKHEGAGIGIDSCRSIVSRYHGTMKVHQDQEMVYVSVLLNL